jgi:hypothetical protein
MIASSPAANASGPSPPAVVASRPIPTRTDTGDTERPDEDLSAVRRGLPRATARIYLEPASTGSASTSRSRSIVSARWPLKIRRATSSSSNRSASRTR